MRLTLASLLLSIQIAPLAGDAVELRDMTDAAEFCAFSEPAANAPRVEGSGEPGICRRDGQSEGARIETADIEQSDLLGDRMRARDHGLERGHLLLETHEVEIAPADFAFLPYDADVGVLALSTVPSFPFAGGAYQLTIEADDTVAFEIDAERAAELEALRAMGSISLRLVFNVASIDDPERPFCVAEPDGSIRIEAHLLAAELVTSEQGGVVMRAESKRLREGCVRHGEYGDTWRAPRPEALVTSLYADSGADALIDEIDLLRATIETELTACYVEGLSENGRLQGALTFGLLLGADGVVRDFEVLVDAVGSATLAACAQRAVEGVLVPRASATADAAVRATVVLRAQTE